jgi:hypothetical protein
MGDDAEIHGWMVGMQEWRWQIFALAGLAMIERSQE